MSVKNRVVRKIEAAKLELETMIKKWIGDTKYDHMKNINFLDMKISAITSNKPSSYY